MRARVLLTPSTLLGVSLWAAGALCLAAPPAPAFGATSPATPPPITSATPPPITSSIASLTLQDAVAKALAANPELSAAQREFEAAEGPVLQAATRPNPELALLLEDTRRATRTTTLLINQPIESGGKRAARIGAAERGRDIAAVDLAARRADLRATVVSAFLDVSIAQEQVELAGDSVALARRAAEAATRRVQAGKISPVEETKARVAEAAARLQAAQAEAELRISRQRLAATWGDAVPGFDRVEAAGDPVPPVPVPALDALSARLAASPGLRRARLEVQRRGALSALERARRTPDLTVSLGVKRDEQLGRNQAVIGLSIPLPLFDRNQGPLLEALRREDQSRDDLAAADIRLRTAVMQRWTQLDTADAQARTLREQVLPGAQSAYDAATRGFALGKFDFLEVLDAQRTLFQARAQYLGARGEAHRAAADIERLLGEGDAADDVPAARRPADRRPPTADR